MTQTKQRTNGRVKADPFEEITDAFNKNTDEVLRTIYEDVGGPIILDSYHQDRIRGGNGKTTVARSTGSYRTGSQAGVKTPFELFTKVYRGINGGNGCNAGCDVKDYMKRPERPWQFEAEFYDLFHESGVVPGHYWFRDIKGLRDKLITLSGGNQTLQAKLFQLNKLTRGGNLAVQQLPLFMAVATTQAFFDDFAEREVMPALIGHPNLSKHVQAERNSPTMEKALNYIRAGMGYPTLEEMPDDIKARFFELYLPIAKRIDNNRRKLVHAALDGENIVSIERGGWQMPDVETGCTGNIKFIDLESIKLRDPFFALSQTLTIPGSSLTPEEFETVMQQYSATRLKRFGYKPGERPGFFGFGKRTEEPKMTENRLKGIRSIFYAGSIHHPLKKGGKLADKLLLFPDDYAATMQETPELVKAGQHQKKMISQNIEYILGNPGQLIVDDPSLGIDSFAAEDIKTLEGLLGFFREIGIAA